MLGTRVYLQLAQLLRAQLVVGEHALDRAADDLLGPPGEQIADSFRAEPAGIAAVAVVAARVGLVARQVDLGGVEHDDVVAAVDVRGEGGFVLAFEHDGDARGEQAEALAGGIHHVPAALDLALSRTVCLGRHVPDSIFLFGRPSVTLARLSPLAAAVSPENAGRDGWASAAAT